MTQLRHQRGFGLLLELIAVAAVLAVAAAGYLMYQSHRRVGNVEVPTTVGTNLTAATKDANVSGSGGATIHVVGATAEPGGPPTGPAASPTPTPDFTPVGGPSATPSPGGTYEVTGTVTEGPTSPVCSTSRPCTAPVANHEVDVYAGTSLATKVMTDGLGHFSLYVPKGTYSIRLNPTVGLGSQSWSFTESGQYVLNLSLSADTGLR